jgi:hypothetical protein
VLSFESVHRHTTKARGGEWAQFCTDRIFMCAGRLYKHK